MLSFPSAGLTYATQLGLALSLAALICAFRAALARYFRALMDRRTQTAEAKDQTKDLLLVGGASDKPVPKAKPGATPKGQQGDKPSAGGGMSGLLDAKRKAQEEIKRREEGEK